MLNEKFYFYLANQSQSVIGIFLCLRTSMQMIYSLFIAPRGKSSSTLAHHTGPAAPGLELEIGRTSLSSMLLLLLVLHGWQLNTTRVCKTDIRTWAWQVGLSSSLSGRERSTKSPLCLREVILWSMVHDDDTA